jgi:5-methylcytosine-specific restriction enzyme A
MAMAPPRPCTRCGRLVRDGSGRCAHHQRPSAFKRGYRTGWAEYARAWLARFPWCGQRADGRFYSDHSACTRRGQRVRARVVDHIRSLASGGALLDATNHQSLCFSCNARKR